MRTLKTIVFVIVAFTATVFLGNVGTVQAQRGSMEWRGTVDDVVRIRIRNRNAQTKVISGHAYHNETFSFSGSEPRQNANVSIDKRRGRGQVLVVKQPNRRNNFTTVVEIVDKHSGADQYRFTLHWN